MGLGNSLNSLAGGYAQGQAQFAANEDARAKAAAAGAKAAQDAAEFRLKLAQHSQTLTNSAETEWNAITSALTDEKWDPAYLSVLLPRAANFDKTYGAVWGGGSAVKTVQDALHLNPVKAEGAPSQGQGEQPQAPSELFGFMSPEQKRASDERAIKSRSQEAAREFTLQAADYAKSPSGGLPDEATYYRKLYEFQDKAMRELDANGRPKYDPATIDVAMDILRENAAPYFKGLADQLDQLDKSTTRKDAINSRIDEVGRQASTWITSLLQMDSKDGGMDMATMFATRTPLRLKMEQEAQRLAGQGMELGQIKMLLSSRFSNEVGGLELDVTKTPGMGALTFSGAPREAVSVVNRIFDTNQLGDREPFTEAVYDKNTNEAWLVDQGTGSKIKVWQAGSQSYDNAGAWSSKAPEPSGAPEGAVAEVDGVKYHKVGGKWEPVK